MSDWTYTALTEKGETGTRGSLRFVGTEIYTVRKDALARTITTETEGITSDDMDICVGDIYINPLTQDWWTCTQAGKPTTALWKWSGRNITDLDDNNSMRAFQNSNPICTISDGYTVTVEQGENPFGESDNIIKVYSAEGTSKKASARVSLFRASSTIDPSKMYRYVCYFKQVTNISGGGEYFGFRGNTSGGDAYIQSLSGASVSNAYHTRGRNIASLKGDDVWLMVVGYIIPYNQEATYVPSDSGVYRCDTKLKVASVTNYKWKIEEVTQISNTGTLIGYTGDASTDEAECYVYDIRFDVCDGNQPTLKELLSIDTSVKFKGVWTSNIAYHEGDTVSYSDGSSYCCILDHTSSDSITPDDDTYWTVIAERGEQGEKGETGDKGADGTSVSIKGQVATYEDLMNKTGMSAGDGYIVESSSEGHDVAGHLFTYSGTEWVDCGQIKGPQGDKADDTRENLCDGNTSNTSDSCNKWSSGTYVYEFIDGIWHFKTTSSSDTAGVKFPKITTEYGKTYCISMKIKTSSISSGSWRFYFRNDKESSNAGGRYYSSTKQYDDWTIYSWTLLENGTLIDGVYDPSTILPRTLAIRSYGVPNGEIWIKDIKVEEGSSATAFVYSKPDQRGENATQYYIHYVYNDSTTEESNYSTTESRKYIGTYVDTTEADIADWETLQEKVAAKTINLIWSQIEGISVGSQILRGTNSSSKMYTTSSKWENGTWAISGDSSNRTLEVETISDCPNPAIQNAWKITNNKTSPSNHTSAGQSYLPLQIGQAYTFSCFARKSSGATAIALNILVWSSSSSATDTYTVQEIEEDWVRCHFTFTPRYEGDGIFIGIPKTSNVTGEYIEICGAKLEVGSTYTDWTEYVPDLKGDSAHWNMLPNSKFQNGVTGWTSDKGTLTDHSDDDIYGTYASFIASGSRNRIYHTCNNSFESGKTYVISYVAKASVKDATIYPSRALVDNGTTQKLTTEWARYTTTITMTASSAVLSFIVGDTTSTFYITNIMVEEGTQSSGWTMTGDETKGAKGGTYLGTATSDPASPVTDDYYLNTASQTLYYYNGSAWVEDELDVSNMSYRWNTAIQDAIANAGTSGNMYKAAVAWITKLVTSEIFAQKVTVGSTSQVTGLDDELNAIDEKAEKSLVPLASGKTCSMGTSMLRIESDELLDDFNAKLLRVPCTAWTYSSDTIPAGELDARLYYTVKGTTSLTTITVTEETNKEDALANGFIFYNGTLRPYKNETLTDILGLEDYYKTYGKTVIEGGYIATGLVHADSIEAGAITADNIDADNLEADNCKFTNVSIDGTMLAKGIIINEQYNSGREETVTISDFLSTLYEIAAPFIQIFETEFEKRLYMNIVMSGGFSFTVDNKKISFSVTSFSYTQTNITAVSSASYKFKGTAIIDGVYYNASISFSQGYEAGVFAQYLYIDELGTEKQIYSKTDTSIIGTRLFDTPIYYEFLL